MEHHSERGMVGPGFMFDGIDDGVTIPNSTSLSQTRITVDAWVYFDWQPEPIPTHH